MGLTSKFYCKRCGQIKSRFQVKCVDNYYNYVYECKYCHSDTERLEHMLVRLDRGMHDREIKCEIHNMKTWVANEANELYPDDKKSRKAFMAGVYSLLDKIGYDYGDKEV